MLTCLSASEAKIRFSSHAIAAANKNQAAARNMRAKNLNEPPDEFCLPLEPPAAHRILHPYKSLQRRSLFDTAWAVKQKPEKSMLFVQVLKPLNPKDLQVLRPIKLIIKGLG